MSVSGVSSLSPREIFEAITKPTASRDDIKRILESASQRSFFTSTLAQVCAYAFRATDPKQSENILCEVYEFIKKTEGFYPELREHLAQDQADKVFLARVTDTPLNDTIVDMLLERGISENALKKALDKCPGKVAQSYLQKLTLDIQEEKKHSDKIVILEKAITTAFECARWHNDWTLVNALQDNEIPGIEKQDREEAVREILAQFFSTLVKNQQLLEHDFFLKKVQQKKLFDDYFYRKALPSFLSQNEASTAFLRYMNTDNHTVLEVIKHYEVKISTLIRVIDTCENPAVVDDLLKHMLGKGLVDRDEVKQVIIAVIKRCVKTKDWNLADVLASNMKPGYEEEYGSLLVHVIAHNQDKNIAKKLFNGGAWLIDNAVDQYDALDWLLERKWGEEFIKEALNTPQGMEGLARSVAASIKSKKQKEAVKNMMQLEKILTSMNNRQAFLQTLQKYLSPEEREQALFDHKYDSDFTLLNILIDLGVSKEVLIRSLQSTSSHNLTKHMEKVLAEEKLNIQDLSQLMDFAIEKAGRSLENWSLVNNIAIKQFNMEGMDRVYGKALVHLISRSPRADLGELEKIVQALIKGGASFKEVYDEKDQETALHWAVEFGRFDIATLLVSAGARTDIPNAKGKTAYQIALDAKQYYEAACLRPDLDATQREKIRKQAGNFNRNKFKLNYLHRVFKYDDTVLQDLLDEDASFKNSKQEEKGSSPRKREKLAQAIFKVASDCKTEDETVLEKNTRILKALLRENNFDLTYEEQEALLRYKDSNGDTALHKAVESGQLEVVKLLLDAGADSNVRNKNLESPLRLAERKQYLCLQKLLSEPSVQKRERAVSSIRQADRVDVPKRDRAASSITPSEEKLQSKEDLGKRKALDALQGDSFGIDHTLTSSLGDKSFGTWLMFNLVGCMKCDQPLAQQKYRENLQRFTHEEIDKLSPIFDRVTQADKIKLKALKTFITNHLGYLCTLQKQYPAVDPFILIFAVREEKLISRGVEWEKQAKEKMDSCLITILTKRLKWSSEEARRQVAGYMSKAQSLVPNLPKDRVEQEEQKETGSEEEPLKQKEIATEEESQEQKAEENECPIDDLKAQICAAVNHDNVNAVKRMADIYRKDVQQVEWVKFNWKPLFNFKPRIGRIAISLAVAIPFLSPSEGARYLSYLESLETKKHYRGKEENENLELLKKFCVDYCKIADQLKKHYDVKTPFDLIFLSFQYIAKQVEQGQIKLQLAPLTERFFESLESVMVGDGKYTQKGYEAFKSKKTAEAIRLFSLKPLMVLPKQLSLTGEEEQKNVSTTTSLLPPVPVAFPVLQPSPPAYQPYVASSSESSLYPSVHATTVDSSPPPLLPPKYNPSPPIPASPIMQPAQHYTPYIPLPVPAAAPQLYPSLVGQQPPIMQPPYAPYVPQQPAAASQQPVIVHAVPREEKAQALFSQQTAPSVARSPATVFGGGTNKKATTTQPQPLLEEPVLQAVRSAADDEEKAQKGASTVGSNEEQKPKQTQKQTQKQTPQRMVVL